MFHNLFNVHFTLNILNNQILEDKFSKDKLSKLFLKTISAVI